jgi:hypothetical protein
MQDDRLLIISRKYRKGPDTHDLFVAQVKGHDISGALYQYELWLNNAEQRDKWVTSGNTYEVRRAFITKLLDLQDDGWSKQGSASFGHQQGAFFDPAGL